LYRALGYVWHPVMTMASGTQTVPGQSSLWQTTPGWYTAGFICVVFLIFSSCAFIQDSSTLGAGAIGPAASALFWAIPAVCYCVSVFLLGRRFWIAALPFSLLQICVLSAIAHRFPAASAPKAMYGAAIARLQSRLSFDRTVSISMICIGFACMVTISIAAARRRARLNLQKATLEGEMAAAREVQCLLVPERIASVVGYDLEAVYRPAASVGGDFFQVIPMRDQHTLIVIGDVSGKGLRAALVVSMLVGIIRTVAQTTMDPGSLLNEINARLLEQSHGGFVTCLAALLSSDGNVLFANAGHLPPWINNHEVPLAGSLPLGLVSPATPEFAIAQLEPSDRLVLMTDGIVEATDARGLLLGFDRVRAMLCEGAAAPDIANAAQAHGQHDDITVLSIRR